MSKTIKVPAPERRHNNDENDYPASVFTWTGMVERFTVVGPSGICQEHSGIGLTPFAVVRHLMQDDWPEAFQGSDIAVYDGGRIVAIIGYTEKRREMQIRFPNEARWWYPGKWSDAERGDAFPWVNGDSPGGDD